MLARQKSVEVNDKIIKKFQNGMESIILLWLEGYRNILYFTRHRSIAESEYQGLLVALKDSDFNKEGQNQYPTRQNELERLLYSLSLERQKPN